VVGSTCGVVVKECFEVVRAGDVESFEVVSEVFTASA
jgi:hypothetical protein